MRAVNFIFLLQASQNPQHTHPLVQALRVGTTINEGMGGAIDAPRVRAEIEARGMRVVEDDEATREHGFRRLANMNRVLVLENGKVIAMGAASDRNEALLHAILGWFREHPVLGLDAPVGAATLPQP